MCARLGWCAVALAATAVLRGAAADEYVDEEYDGGAPVAAAGLGAQSAVAAACKARWLGRGREGKGAESQLLFRFLFRFVLRLV
eukprot:SAG31_NODE_25359_length_463_cov_0.505495_1_plen_83_part_01